MTSATTTRTGDLLGLALSAIVVAIPIFWQIYNRHSRAAAFWCAVGGSAGILIDGVLWIRLGRPSSEELTSTHRGLLAVFIAVFVAGLTPALIVGG